MTTELNSEECFKILGIKPTADINEIKTAYHELSKKYHPDSPNGSHEKQSRLNNAYEAALSYSNSGQLVAVEVKKAIQIIERSVARQQASQEISNFSTDTLRIRTKFTQRMKYIAFLAAGISGFFGFIAVVPGMPGEQISFLKTVAIMFGAIGGGLQFLIQHQSQIIDSFKETLSDENNCVVQLRRYGVTANQPFTIDDILQRLGLLKEVQIADPTRLTLQEMIEIRHGASKTKIAESGTRDPILRLLLPILGGSPFRLSPLQAAKMTILKGEEHGILANISKRPRVYEITADFKSMFH